MAQRNFEHKMKDSHFKARSRDVDRPAIGAPSNGKAKGQSKCQKQLQRGECIRWITIGQGSFGSSCAFKHEPNKKDRGEKRLRSPSPTGSHHRNSKGDGKGSHDGSTKGEPTLAGKSPSGKANRVPCTNSKKGRCQKWKFM